MARKMLEEPWPSYILPIYEGEMKIVQEITLKVFFVKQRCILYSVMLLHCVFLKHELFLLGYPLIILVKNSLTRKFSGNNAIHHFTGKKKQKSMVLLLQSSEKFTHLHFSMADEQVQKIPENNMNSNKILFMLRREKEQCMQMRQEENILSEQKASN